MLLTRRAVLHMGVALSAVPWLENAPAAERTPVLMPTGWPEIDKALGGGMRSGTFMVVLGDEHSGKSEFMKRLAQVNGVADMHTMNSGSSDMFSLTRRPDGQYAGCLMLNSPEPMTEKE